MTAAPVDCDDLEAYRLLIADVYELAGRSRASSDRMARAAGQSAARWHLMSAISDGARSVASAARRLGLARQSVQRVANGIVRDGLAVMQVDPDDARAPRLALTARGRRTLRTLFGRSDRDRCELLMRAGCDANALLAARATIRALNRAFDD